VCCSVLQCAAVCCSVLRIAVDIDRVRGGRSPGICVLQCVAVCCSVL